MRTFFGIILGAVLTVGVLYVHDAMATSTVASNGASQAIVNWDVAAIEWGHLEDGVNTAWLKLKSSYNG